MRHFNFYVLVNKPILFCWSKYSQLLNENHNLPKDIDNLTHFKVLYKPKLLDKMTNKKIVH